MGVSSALKRNEPSIHEKATLNKLHTVIPAFWKRQNYGDSKGIGIDVGGMNTGHRGFLRAVK